MKKVAIYGQAYTISAEKEIKILLAVLKKYNIVVFFEQKFYDLLIENKSLEKKYPTFSHFNDLSDSFDLLFTIGGDGTFLRAITYVRNLDIPMMGINTGRLGFLATIQKDQIEESIELLLKKEYSIQERTLLQIETTPTTEEFSELNFALNEITIARRNTTSMIGIKTYLNNEYLTNYWADGLIISTPTGSTAYSLSCGGPIVVPGTNNIVLTPIAPHNLNVRPVVINADSVIKLKIEGRASTHLLSMDSRSFEIENEVEVVIKKGVSATLLVQLKEQNFFNTLRNKLSWGIDKRN